ncbi:MULTISPECIES: hypothetical protein [unclassified Nocardioides]|uniref:PIN-like domain-containing protein n=1 Tax=unclassified Nocardioides TaxID=2615069 RepID=UPI0000571B3F|nr:MULTISPECIES: hypothetical protein [unclassified Nocardioides]ABL81534.1 conserved hypothetical protein [Nocardioides sp. JS614]
MTGLHFFVDRSLGRRQVPDLLRADGWDLATLAEHYGIPADEDVTDVEWLRLAGQHAWPVLMKDERIRYRSAERAALLEHGVRAFCLTSGNLTGREMAELFIGHRSAIWDQAAGAGAALFAVSRTALRQVDLND